MPPVPVSIPLADAQPLDNPLAFAVSERDGRILAEVQSAFRVHESAGSTLGGVHFELTGEDVTECTGGARGLADVDLGRAYRSTVDPRLNYEQALELAMIIAGKRQR